VDPEQIYQEVLSEEQAKGSPSAVAEARAKAARQRAVHGSPHPKEPRWWPGSQPQFEGGDAPAAAAPEPEVEEEAAPEPEAPAAEAPAATPPDLGDESQSEQPAAAAPAPPASTEAQQLAAQPAAAAVAAPAAAAPSQQLPAGVTHGTDSGNRLRPEDSVGTDAQFDAQKALAERRRLIDELVATGVPAATAEQSGRPKAPLLLLAYVLIPLLAIFLLQQASDDEAEAGGGAAPVTEDGGGEAGPTTSIAAEGSKFNLDTMTFEAGKPVTLTFDNKDPVQHNVAIYEDDSAAAEIFKGEIVAGPDEAEYEFDAPKAGEYFFRCDVHPDMNGTVVTE
jgi:plastocyanin